MPDAQIPVIIMTPNKAVPHHEKSKVKQHPLWQPYSFDFLELNLDKQEEEKNEYAKYRKWLIKKEKDYVEEQIKKNPDAKFAEITKQPESVVPEFAASGQKAKHVRGESIQVPIQTTEGQQEESKTGEQ